MSKVLKPIALATLFAASGTAFTALAAEGDKGAAQERPAAGPGRGGFAMMRLKRMDADKNGTVSKVEFLAQRTEEFKTMDSNQDNAVDPAEIGAALQEPAEFRTKRFLKRVDANRDGKVSREEFEQGPRAQFAGRDINSDGKINADDRPPSGGGLGWFGGGGGKKMALGRGNRQDQTLENVLARSKAEFAKIDTNSDGSLDQAELANQGNERIEFSKKRMMHWSDENKDGRLTEDEFTARAAKRFATLDLNDDGQIDGTDFPSSARKGWFTR
jgi:Ca2+-binding EF-hand superfamily protein